MAIVFVVGVGLLAKKCDVFLKTSTVVLSITSFVRSDFWFREKFLCFDKLNNG
jgi:hypothetical protein